MSGKLFGNTRFVYVEGGREVIYYGIAEHLAIPPGFEVGDLVKLFIKTNCGFNIPVTRIEPGMFSLVYLRRFDITDPEELWTVKKI